MGTRTDGFPSLMHSLIVVWPALVTSTFERRKSSSLIGHQSKSQDPFAIFRATLEPPGSPFETITQNLEESLFAHSRADAKNKGFVGFGPEIWMKTVGLLSSSSICFSLDSVSGGTLILGIINPTYLTLLDTSTPAMLASLMV